MFTDIVGYSKMVEKDETHALKILNEHDQLIDTVIRKNNGKIIKHIGDAVFADFPSTVDAVNSAINFQNKFKDRNVLCRKDDCIVVRVGIHKGEVIEQDDDLFGNAVNLGSRIEGTAPPGGIAISAIVKKELSNNILVREIGHVKLKNISQPLEIFKVYLDKEEFKAENAQTLRQLQIERGINIVDIDSFQAKKEYSVAILYPHVIGKEENDYACYSFLGEFIQEMRKIEGVRMSSLQDIIKFKGSESPVSEIARSLKTEAIIDGSFAFQNDLITLNLRMTNCVTGKLVWEKEIEGKKVNSNQIMAELISLILNEYELSIPDNILRYLSRSMTRNIDALNHYQKGFYLLEKTSSNDELMEASNCFEQAIKLDESFIEARMLHGVVQGKLGANEKAESLLKATLEIAKKDNYPQGIANAYNGLFFVYDAMNRYPMALEACQNALKIQKNLDDRLKEAKMLSNLSGCYNALDEPESAKNYLAQAIRIQEEIGEDKTLAFPYAQLGNSCKMLLDYSGAIENYTKALAKFTSEEMDYWQGRVMILLSEAYIFLGMDNKAKHYLNRAEEINKQFDEPLISGLSNLQHAQLLLKEADYENATDSYIECIDQFQIAESKSYLSQALYEVCVVYILQRKQKSLKRSAGQLKTIAKKNQDILYQLRAEILIAFHLAVEDNNFDETIIDKIENDIGLINKSDILPIDWWIMGQILLTKKNIEKSELMFNYIDDQIQYIGNKISDKTQKDSFENKNVFNLIARNKDFIESEKIQNAKTSKFCPECGKPIKGGKFCMECGFKLI